MTVFAPSSIPYLFRRGGVWWWRRRLPRPHGAHPPLRPRVLGSPEHGHVPQLTLALSLRTACRAEARRRGARLSACFEDAVAAGKARMDGAAEMQASFARDLLALLREQVAQLAAQMAAQQAASSEALARQTELSLALVNKLGAPPGPAVTANAAPRPASGTASPAPAPAGSIDDPEFEAALMELADRNGWWHDDGDEVLEQFDWMLVGLMTVQSEYVRYCARKGLDPATALPSIARLAGTLQATAAATGAMAAVVQKDEAAAPSSAGASGQRAGTRDPALDAAPPSARPAPGEATRRRSNLLVSETFERYLAMRCMGCKLDPEREVPSPKIGAKFAQTMRPNIESTQHLIIEILGDKPIAAIDADQWKTFVDTLPRVPRNHGKSSRDKRSLMAIIEETDRIEALDLAQERTRLLSLRMPPQEIDAALAARQVARLATTTCVRHQRAVAAVLDYAIHHKLLFANHMRPLIWAEDELARRAGVETAPERRPWKDAI